MVPIETLALVASPSTPLSKAISYSTLLRGQRERGLHFDAWRLDLRKRRNWILLEKVRYEMKQETKQYFVRGRCRAPSGSVQ